MKKLCFVAFGLLMVLGYIFLPRIVESDYDVLCCGRIVSINEEQSMVKIIDNKEAFREFELPLIDVASGEKLEIGNKIFVYINQFEIFASTISLEDAKLINRFLEKDLFEKLLNPWCILLVFLVSAIFMYWVILVNHPVHQKVFLGVCLLLIIPLMYEPNFKLFEIDRGEVFEVLPDNEVMINNGIKYPLTKNIDIATNEEIKKGDFVYFYRYGLFNVAEYQKVFVSTKRFDVETLRYSGTYPYIFLITLCAISLVMVAYGFVWEIVRRLKNKEE